MRAIRVHRASEHNLKDVSLEIPIEAMTVFTILTAGLYPIVHIGRSWLFFFVPSSTYLLSTAAL